MEIQRDFYLNQLIAGKHNGLIKVVTGLRRCGKSYLLFKLFYRHLIASGVDDSHIVKVALDDFEFVDLLEPIKLYRFIKEQLKDSDMYYVLLDEVQLVPGFEKVLNSLLHIDNVDVYVTGSNSRFLSSDIITEFRGRGDEIRVYPLSFSEFCQGSGLTGFKAWNDYCVFGGMPHVLSLDNDDKKLGYLSDLFSTVYLVDMVERHRVRSKEEFAELLKFMASNIGGLTNTTKLSNTFKSAKNVAIGPATLAKYLSYCEDAFIIKKAERYDLKGKRYIGGVAKYYFTDIGVRNAIIGMRQQEESHIMENVIYNELLRRGFRVDVGVVPQRIVDENNKWQRRSLEVDFVANRGNKCLYIQSALMIPDEQKRRQETASLKALNQSFAKIVVVKDDFRPWYDDDGIFYIGLIDFLMDESLI